VYRLTVYIEADYRYIVSSKQEDFFSNICVVVESCWEMCYEN